MPELGETWSMGEMAAAATGATGRLEAIVIATGPSRIRLITRTGRRITAPVSSWERVWHFVREAPVRLQPCERERCSQEAFFRYHLSPGRVSWVCEDHLPHGVSALFPGDRNELAEPRLSCVFCGGSVTQGDVIQLYERATVTHECGQCKARWCPLVSRGLGDDGTLLAQDIHGLRTLTTLPFIEVRMGYRSYRDLCRALGVGNTQHVDGLPIIQDHRLEDQLTLAIQHRAERQDSAPPPQRPPAATHFEARSPSLDPESTWRRRRPGSQVVVKIASVEETAEGPRVHYTYLAGGDICNTYEEDPLVQTRADFLRYWAPLDEYIAGDTSLHPHPGTIWCHIKSRQIVEIKLPTTTQVANGQVSYVTVNGSSEATSLKTFRSWYCEVPMPPEDHYWVRPSSPEVFEVTRRGDVIYLHDPRGLAVDLPRLSLPAFLQLYDALYFFSRYDDRNVHLAADDPKGALVAGHEWQDSQGTVVVLDVGLTCSGSEFVRYKRLDVESLMPVNEFIASFRYEEPPAPCAEGETWVHRDNDEITVIIVEVRSLRGVVNIEEQQSTHRYEIRVSELLRYYRRLNIRSYWDLLEAEDGET